MSKYLPVFTSPEGEAETLNAYQAVLARWPVPYTELDIPTSLGSTHVIASGPEAAPPVVLLHAFFASAMAWFPTAGALSRQYRVYAVDMIGEPNKSRPTRVIKTMQEQLQWFQELAQGLKVETMHLVGNSFGAFTGAYFAMKIPERIRKLVLIAPAATFRQILPFYLHCLLPKFAYLAFPRSHRLKRWTLQSVDWIRNRAPLDSDWEELFRKFMLYGTGARAMLPRVYAPSELRQIRVPTLLLIGDREVIYSPHKTVEAARRHIPQLQSVILPDANHIAALSQPELVNREILKFFSAPPILVR
jgi:pimeloyl-ACP methyl ester carboxylesterase